MLILVAIAVAWVAGTAALVVGLIGKRLDDHPTCRACGFDLVGRGVTVGGAIGAPCPECGKQIATDKDVRLGNRTRRRGALVAGMFLLTLALLIAIPFVVVPLAGKNASKPTWLLLVEAEYGTTKWQEAAADELMNRHVAGTLAEAEGSRLVTLAAAVHANTNVAFTKIWREIMSDEVLFAMLPDATRDAAAVRGVEPFLKLRGKVRSGKGVPVPFGIAMQGSERVVRANERMLGIRRVHWRVTRPTGELVTVGTIDFEYHHLLGLMDTPTSTTWHTQCLEVDLEPGTYVLGVELDACIVARSAMTGAARRRELVGPVVTMSEKGQFEVLEEGKSSVEVVEDEKLLERVRSSVRLGPKHVARRPTRGAGSVEIRYDVKYVDDGRRMENNLHTSWHAELWSADGSARVEGVTQQTAAWMPINGSLQGGTIWMNAERRVASGKYRLKLLADPGAAERTEHVTRILGGELEFEVELEEGADEMW